MRRDVKPDLNKVTSKQVPMFRTDLIDLDEDPPNEKLLNELQKGISSEPSLPQYSSIDVS